MGPCGVDHLVRQALQECWTSLPEDCRTFANWQKRAEETFARNRKVWSAIKKPAPAAFFENMAPYPSDGHLRQAMILCWMMLPRAGGRDFKDVVKRMDAIFRRNMDAWEEDNKAFSAKSPKTTKRVTRRKPAARSVPLSPRERIRVRGRSKKRTR